MTHFTGRRVLAHAAGPLIVRECVLDSSDCFVDGHFDRFVKAGNRVAHVRLRGAPRGEQIVHFDFTDLTNDTATPFAIALPQDRTERLLLDAVTATGLVDIRFDTKVVGFEQDVRGIKLLAKSPDREYELGGD